MKTSNKIITAIIALLILIPALVVATIIFRYKNGDFTRIEIADNWKSRNMKGITSLHLQGLQNLEIIPSDTLRLEYDFTNINPGLKFSGTNDSMSISGDTSYIRKDTAADGTVTDIPMYERSSNSIKLYLPSGYPLTLKQCDFRLAPGAKEINAGNLQLALENCEMQFQPDDTAIVHFDRMAIAGKTSTIILSSSWNIRELDLNLKDNCNMRANESKTGSIRLDIDSTSSISLNGQQYSSIIQKK